MNTTQLKTVSNIQPGYIDSHYTLDDLMDCIIDWSDDLVYKSVAKSMNTDKIYIENSSQWYYEGRRSDHSVSSIDNLSEIIPLMIADRPDLITIRNDWVDSDGDVFDSTYIEDIQNCYHGDKDDNLYNCIIVMVENLTDDIVDDLINIGKNRDDAEYTDAVNLQAFAEFLEVNSIESDEYNFYDFDYINRKKPQTHEQLIAGWYTQITDDLYNDLYVKLPELVEHTRQTIDDWVVTNTTTFYTFI